MFRFETSVEEWKLLKHSWQQAKAHLESNYILSDCVAVLQEKLFNKSYDSSAPSQVHPTPNAPPISPTGTPTNHTEHQVANPTNAKSGIWSALKQLFSEPTKEFCKRLEPAMTWLHDKCYQQHVPSRVENCVETCKKWTVELAEFVHDVVTTSYTFLKLHLLEISFIRTQIQSILAPFGGTELAGKQELKVSDAQVKDQDENDFKQVLQVQLAKQAGVKHIAVIMDGNRRYGKKYFGDPLKGHWEGGKTLEAFIDACIDEGLQVLTVYAFSTENWNRSPKEVSTLMNVLIDYADKMRNNAKEKRIRVRVCSSSRHRLSSQVADALEKLEQETENYTDFLVNICISYSGREEIVCAAKSIAKDVVEGNMSLDDIDEKTVARKLTTSVSGIGDPDIMIRTSGEQRLSNFLLYQLAYTEFFFVDKLWPEVKRDDLRHVLQDYMLRHRRFGK